MNIPVHWLHIYNKPKLGSNFIRRYPALQYKHRIIANGGFDTASCTLPVQRAEGETIFENYVGNRVAIFANNPFDPIWEGYINRVTFTLPGVVLTRSLDEMGNRTQINQGNAASAVPTTITTVNNTASQAVYGVKCKALRAARTNAGGTTFTASLAARALNDIAFPITSVANNTGAVDAIIELELKGFYYTLDWENSDSFIGTRTFRNGSTGWFDTFLANHANLTTFMSASAVDLVNNAQTYAGVAEGGTIWSKMQMVAECGNNAQRWICGVGPYDVNTGTRRMYYRPADLTVKYLSKINAPGRLFSAAGAPLESWAARPDGVVRITDALVGWDGDGFDPREIYIAALEYDADTGMVAWQSDDNIQIAGALQTDKWHTASDMKYGQRASNPLM